MFRAKQGVFARKTHNDNLRNLGVDSALARDVHRHTHCLSVSDDSFWGESLANTSRKNRNWAPSDQICCARGQQCCFFHPHQHRLFCRAWLCIYNALLDFKLVVLFLGEPPTPSARTLSLCALGSPITHPVPPSQRPPALWPLTLCSQSSARWRHRTSRQRQRQASTVTCPVSTWDRSRCPSGVCSQPSDVNTFCV